MFRLIIVYGITYILLRLGSEFNMNPYYKIVVHLVKGPVKIIDLRNGCVWNGFKGFCNIIRNLDSSYKDKKYKYVVLDSSKTLYSINNKYFTNKKTFEKILTRRKSFIFKLILKLKFGNIESCEEIVI